MLSKINYYSKKSHFDLEKSRDNLLYLDLVDYLNTKGSTLDDIKPLSMGTLGLSYLAKINNHPVFLKTHLDSVLSKENLFKEIVIYKNYYSSSLNCKKIVVSSVKKNTNQIWLLMNVLCPSINKINPNMALNVIRNFPHINTIKKNLPIALHNFDIVLYEGYQALESLEKQKYLTKEIVLTLSALIRRIENNNKHFELSLCHGDFSPLNIMQNNNQLIAIDWEDAFYGPKGYDYLYWLTFFYNRIFYNKFNLDRSGFDIDISIALMCLIILIKGKLSICSGDIKKNKLSISDRLNEVININ